MAIPLAFIPVISQTITELFKFKTNTMQKEAISLAVVPAIVIVYTSMSEVCADGCTFTQAMFAPSGVEYAALITGIVALAVRLNQKRKDTEQAE